MPQIINTNIASLNSQRHLNSSQSSLSTALERLSSGKRINSAKDDAAGLGISERMTSQVNGMNQAIRNSRDGISMSQTAEGALKTSGEMLQRIRTLAVQSSNATNSSMDRQAMQDEVSQLSAELNRIAQTTQFNGQNLLDGTMGAQNYQVGANAGDLITTSGTNFQTSLYGTNRIKGDAVDIKATIGTAVGWNSAKTAATAAAKFTSEAITINGRLGSATTTAGDGKTTAKDLAAKINVLADQTGVTATASTEACFRATADSTYSVSLQSDNASPVTVSFSIGSTLNADGYAQAINAFNAQSSKTGVTAEWDEKASGIKLVNSSGNDIYMANQQANADTTTVPTLASYKADGTAVAVGSATSLTKLDGDGYSTVAVAKGTVTFDSEGSYSLTATLAATSAFGIQDNVAVGSSAVTGTSKLKSVAELDVTSFDKAQLAIAICDGAINTINKEMARYGALQARFETTISNLEVNAENTSNARSRIQDADYAQETASLSRASILQQAGTAMLAQANQMPQSVLSLIG